MAIHIKIGSEDLGELDMERLTISDAIRIKAQSGLTIKTFLQGIEDFDPLALQALIWLQRTRLGQQIDSLHTINFEIGDLDLEDTDDAEDPTVAAGAAKTT